jgi:hypothetical protein
MHLAAGQCMLSLSAGRSAATRHGRLHVSTFSTSRFETFVRFYCGKSVYICICVTVCMITDRVAEPQIES